MSLIHNPTWRPRVLQAAQHWPLALTLLLGLKLRLMNLLPTYFYGDDAEYGTVAQYLSRDFLYLAYPEIEHFGPTPFVSQPPLILYLMAISIRIFGPSETSLVLVSVILGTLTVAAVYALGCVLQGRVTGTLASLLVAAMPYHIDMSRKAFLDAGLVFFFTLTILFVTLWLKHRETKWAVWTGVAAGLTLLSKLPGILILPVLGIVLLVELLVAALGANRVQELKRTLKQAGWAFVPIATAVLSYFALLFHLGATVDWWMKLMWQLGRVDPEFAVQQEVTQVIRPVDWYFTDPQYGLPAQLGEFLILMALTGAVLLLAHMLARPRASNRLGLPVLVYAIVILTFFTYSTRKEAFYMLPVSTAAALLAAVPVGALVALFALEDLRDRRWWKRSMAAGGLSVALVLAAIPAYAGVTGSVDKYSDYEKKFGYGVKEAAFWIHENDPGAGQIGSLLGRFTLYYYNGHPTYHWYVPHDFIHQKIESGEIRYVVYDTYLGLAHEEGWMQGMINEYNGEVVAEWGNDWGSVQVVRLHP